MEIKHQVINSEERYRVFKELLQLSGLPTADLNFKDHLLIGFFDGDDMVGTGALEIYGSNALLRSLSVKLGIRGKSLGSSISEKLIEEARLKNLKAIYLLTESARDFFLKKGFQDIPREKVPPEVQRASEFSKICSPKANVMVYSLMN